MFKKKDHVFREAIVSHRAQLVEEERQMKHAIACRSGSSKIGDELRKQELKEIQEQIRQANTDLRNLNS